MKTSVRCIPMALLVGVACGAVGFLWIGSSVQWHLAKKQIEEDHRIFRKVIADHPEYQKLDLEYDTSGYGMLFGKLPSDSEKEKLRRLLIDAQAPEWADKRLLVRVNASAPPASQSHR